MTQDAHLKMIHTSGSTNNKKQPVIGFEYIQTNVDGRQQTIQWTACVRRALRDKFMAAHNVKPPWVTEASIQTFREIEHHAVVNSGVLADEFND